MVRFGLIGNPVSGSRSPELFEKAYGGRWPYDLVEAETFDGAWKIFIEGPYKAVNVTSPFKADAAARADLKSPEVLSTGAANILVKADGGVEAHNSDYLAVLSILRELSDCSTAAVIGFGGAGKAALTAATDAGLTTELFRHDGIENGVSADVIIYTLPSAVPGIDRLESKRLIEANYKNPCLSDHSGYIPGSEWLYRQAVFGYALMTGETPCL